MNRTAVYGALLVAFGVAAGVALVLRAGNHAAPVKSNVEDSVSGSTQSRGADEIAGGGSQHIPLERRLELLASKLAAEGAQRRRLEERLDRLTTELAALRGTGHEAPQAAAQRDSAAPTTPAAPSAAGDTASPKEAVTTMESALVAAGIDATTAIEIRRRRDTLSLSEIYLRDLATREGWLDTPRFAAEMADIERQRTSLRDEIGDAAYDHYLAALNQPNRVAVDEVLLESPAAAAGLQAGDVVLRYGDTRIFSPDELVTATRGGVAGESVRLEIIRQGQQFAIEVPRGPLGIRIAASRGDPDAAG